MVRLMVAVEVMTMMTLMMMMMQVESACAKFHLAGVSQSRLCAATRNMEEETWRRRCSAEVFVSNFLGRDAVAALAVAAGEGAAVAVAAVVTEAGSLVVVGRIDLKVERTAHMHMRRV
jgi:hypothetical protein